MEPLRISVAKDFTPTPGPRYNDEGEFSGQLFRQSFLYPSFQQALKENRKLIVDLDGTAGYGTSFLEEAFGGLIREEKMDYKVIIANLSFISNEEDYLIEDVLHYLGDADKNRMNAEKVKQTVS